LEIYFSTRVLFREGATATASTILPVDGAAGMVSKSQEINSGRKTLFTFRISFTFFFQNLPRKYFYFLKKFFFHKI
jgi:hypothetical protein